MDGESLSADALRILRDELRPQTTRATPETLAADTGLGQLPAWAAETGTDTDRKTIASLIQDDAVLLTMLRSALAKTLTIGTEDAVPRRNAWLR